MHGSVTEGSGDRHHHYTKEPSGPRDFDRLAAAPYNRAMSALPRCRSRAAIPQASLHAAGLLLVTALAACQASPSTSANVPDIPVHAGATLEWAELEAGSDPTEMYHLPGQSAPEVHAWYVREMREQGWTPTTAEADEVILYVDADGCHGLVSVVQDGPDVKLQISQQEAGTPCLRPLPVAPGDE